MSGGEEKVAEGTLIGTCSAPTNIAVIKYWGKRDTTLNLPINSSVSVTLDQDVLRAVTTVVASSSFGSDRLFLNGEEEDVSKSKRIMSVLREIRARITDIKDADGNVIVAADEAKKYGVHIVSKNTFPTAAGLASSAAGYACLVATLAHVFQVKESYVNELTTIARQGSGSASRSLYGGLVRWEMGKADDGTDSVGVQVAKRDHWPELEILICVVSDAKKETGSTVGMQRSVETSPLLAHRAKEVVPERLAKLEEAYLAKDFETFGRLTMQDSNQFHAVCLDTFPPVFYMNDVSRAIIGLVHRYNEAAGGIKVAYTFDAGPNAVLYTTKSDTKQILSAILKQFPGPEGGALGDYVSDSKLAEECAAAPLIEGLAEPKFVDTTGVKYIYHSRVGDGPRVRDASEHLADATTGLPL